MSLSNGAHSIALPLGDILPDGDNSYSTFRTRCRLCASREFGMLPIFSEEGKRLALAYKINKLLPTLVTPVDQLPQEVCSKCVNDLNIAYEFVKKCVLSQIKLNKMLRKCQEDNNISIKVIQDYSAHWSTGACPENAQMVKEYQKKRSRRHDIQSKGLCIGETEKNGELKRIKLSESNILQNRKMSSTLDAVVTGIEEAISPLSSVFSDNNSNIDRESVSKCESSAESLFFPENTSKNTDSAVPIIKESSKTARPCKHFCQFCGDGFPWKADLFDHQTKRHPELVFRCSFCLKVFYEKDELDTHEQAHAKLFPFGPKLKKQLPVNNNGKKLGEKLVSITLVDENQSQPLVVPEVSEEIISVKFNEKKDISNICSYCNMSFESVKLLDKHLKLEHQFRLPCRFCPSTCSSINELTKHEAKHRSKPMKLLMCKKCESYCDSVSELMEHGLIHLHKDGLKCEICGEAFVNEVCLEEHIKNHDDGSNYLCETCGLNFESFYVFRVHKLCDMYPDLQRCTLCNSCFYTVNDLENHLEVVHKKRKHQCKVCEQKFMSIELLREHKVTHQKTEFKCDSCEKTFTTAKKLRNHAQSHSSERNYLCEKCGKDFKMNSSLHKHRYLCQVAVSCSVCERKFDCATRLKIHMRIHTGEKPHVCTVCGKGFHATWALNQHMVIHNTVKVPCPICGTQFNRKANMMTHMKRHRVPCDICGKVFANTPLLQLHQKEHVESGEKPADIVPSKTYQCNECDKLFVTSLDLKAHLPSHSDDSPHKCNVCNKSFRRLKALKKHMLSHSGRKPYQCRYCTCTFVVHQRLLKHENGHTAGKPYVCEVCGQGFWSPLNLEKHSLKHNVSSTTEQEYYCNYCEKSFSQKSSLIIHKRTHEAQLTYSCSFCPRKFSQLRFMRRHKCALNPNPEASDSSVHKGALSSLSVLTEEPMSDNIFPVSVLNEEIVYDVESSASYAEIIVISQNIDEYITENNSELNK